MGSSSESEKQAIAAYLERAEESLDAAKTLFDSNFFRGSISHAYYSAFYAARACLLLEGVHPKTHSGTVAKFGELFVKPGRTGRRSGRILNELEEDRQRADYQVTIDIGQEEAQSATEDAKFFLNTAREICRGELEKAID